MKTYRIVRASRLALNAGLRILTTMTTENYSVQTLRDYLLGQLSEPEAERLDELSIVDDVCAERIRAVEFDLVDAFARGELHGEVLEQFRSRYLTTPTGREAIRFAEALQSLDETSRTGHVRQRWVAGRQPPFARQGAGASGWPLPPPWSCSRPRACGWSSTTGRFADA